MYLAASWLTADPITRIEPTYATKSAEQTPASGFAPNCD